MRLQWNEIARTPITADRGSPAATICAPEASAPVDKGGYRSGGLPCCAVPSRCTFGHRFRHGGTCESALERHYRRCLSQ